MFWSYTFMFIYCELGEKVSEAFEKLNESIDQLDWYLFSIEIQRLLPTFMIASQQPILIRGLGGSVYTRDTFKRVSSTSSLHFFFYCK